MKTIAWDLWLYCNYDCKFCNTKTKIKPEKIYSIDELYNVWQNIYNKYGKCKICITGGEPLLYPNIEQIIEKLSKIHFVHITTNFSIDIRFLLNNNINKDSIFFNISFHPCYTDVNQFIKKILEFKKYGYKFSICYMSDESQLLEFLNYKKVFNKQNIDISLVKYNNNNSNYKFLNNFIDNNSISLYNKHNDVEKIFCNAGFSYACINSIGDAFPCSVLKHKLGNIFDGSFSFLENRVECNKDCKLLENKY